MHSKKKWLLLLVLLSLVIIIRVIAANSVLVETQYSTGIYLHISAILRYIFGWLPFSIGDVLYAVLAVWILVKTGSSIHKIVRRKYTGGYLQTKLFPFTVTLLLIYIVFNILWGLNYNRKGITYQLGITTEKYSTADIVLIDSLLVTKVNESKASLIEQGRKYYTTDETLDAVKKAYDKVSRQYPWLSYKPPSAKTSLWGWAGNYLGFTGYYNPFTGEAQLNTTVPKFIQPFTASHEVAHQLGYAKENEANFVGYLAATSSSDTLLHYSTYLDLYLYAQKNLYQADSNQAKHFSSQLLPQVKDDLKELKAFYAAHRSPLEPFFKWLYEKYLENNQQPAGLLTYDEVTGFLIAYHKKFGRI